MKRSFNVVYCSLRKLGIDRESILKNFNLRNDLGIGSLDMLVLTNQLEFGLNIAIPDEDINKLNNFEGILNYLKGNYPSLR